MPVNTVLVRYNSNGSLDTTFGTGGIVQEPTAVGAPLAMAQLSNGDYLARDRKSTLARNRCSGGVQLDGSVAIHGNAGNSGGVQPLDTGH